MISKFRINTLGYCCWCLLLIMGCGGGGGGGGAGNSSPIANAGADQTVSVYGTETRTVTLSGTDSDSDGTISVRQWTQTAGTEVALSNADSATATFSVSATEETYTFSYTVTDNDGATASDEINVSVIINASPTADAGDNQSITVSGSATVTVTLSGTDSDTDGSVVTRKWEQTEGTTVPLTNADSATATFPVGSTAETYTFTYTVTDDDKATASDEVSIFVNSNSLPVVDAGTYDTYTVYGSDDLTITLTATATDSDGTIESHLWAQTEGTTTLDLSDDDTTSATFSFAVPAETATYTFSYTATDNDNGSSTDTATIYVVKSLFSDAFADSSQWTPENGGNWSIENDQFLQSQDVIDFDESYHLGTYAYLSDPSISEIPDDYRFSVDITPSYNMTTNTRQGNDVGVMFRYQDDYNYYRVSMSARYGFTRFEKVKSGTFSTLAVNAIGYAEEDGDPINIAVEVHDSSIVVWIDYVPVFATIDDDPIASGSIALYGQDRVLFDNVSLTEPSLEPTVAIATPLAYSVALTTDDTTDTLDVKAVAFNLPTSGYIGFALDDEDEISVSATDSDGYYVTDYTSVADGDHTITAVLRNADGESLANDINDTVGVGGYYYVAVGDSITDGIRDYDDSNNDSADGRIVSRQGFQAPLADLLTDDNELPNIVFNEGVSGDESENLQDRIDSILERHPGANRVLMMIGTNDSADGGTGISANVYETYIENIVTAVDDNGGKELWIAYPMKTYEDNTLSSYDTDRNNLLSEYNAKINTIASSHTGTHLGPNFFTTFNSASYYYDSLHPNDSGYEVMAEEWSDRLSLYP